MIPLTMRLKVRQPDEEGGKRINLWIPLFLAWILLLPVVILIAAVWLLLKVLSPVSKDVLAATRIIEASVVILWKIDGLRIDVRDRESRFILHF